MNALMLSVAALFAQEVPAGKLAEALERRCQLLIAQGDVSRGLADCSAAILVDPANLSHYLFRGIQLWKQSRWTEAYSDFSVVLAKDKKSCKALAYRGATEVNLGHPIPALRDLDEAVACEATDPLSRYSRGLARLMISDVHGALEDFTKAIEQDPTYAEAYEKRAKCYESLGNSQRAREDNAKASSVRKKAGGIGRNSP